MWPLSGKEIFEMIHDAPCPHVVLNDLQIEGILTDSRAVRLRDDKTTVPLLFVAIQGEKFDGHAYLKSCFSNGVALALVSRNSTFLHELGAEQLDRCIVVDDVIQSLRKLAQKFRKSFSFPVIGIGGSNGKTTTKEILSSFLSFNGRKITKTQKSENGFLGIAVTILQKEHTKINPPHALVLEIGIDEIGAMEKHVQIANPDVRILTALGPEHLTGLKNWDTAAKEELVLFTGCGQSSSGMLSYKRIWQLCDAKIREHFLKITQENSSYCDISKDICVVEKKDTHLSPCGASVIFWSIKDQTPESLTLLIESMDPAVKPRDDTLQLRDDTLQPRDDTLQLRDDTLQLGDDTAILFHGKVSLPGKHNAANFALAFGAALALNLSPQNIMDGFQNFTLPPGRSKISNFRQNTVLIDDTYNASPASVSAALNLLNVPEWNNKKKIFVLGDMLELGDESKFWHEGLFNYLKELQRADLCLFGPAMYNCYILFKQIDERRLKDQQLTVTWLDADNDPAQFLKKASLNLEDAIILVKGSRSMRLERFVHCVENFFS